MKCELTKENAQNWKEFVARFVAMQTATKAGREYSRGHQVKAVKGGWTILFGGRQAGYGVMQADVLYSWMTRLPLEYYRREADDIRYELLK